jgi:hypothetical protein
VGGNFTSTSDATTTGLLANYVAYWNVETSRWIQMGGTTATTNGTNALVSALALDFSKNAFLGGNFTKASTTAGDISANYGIVWTPSTANWSNLGAALYRNGLTDGSCNALALDSSNQRIYVGGSFTTVKYSSNVLLSSFPPRVCLASILRYSPVVWDIWNIVLLSLLICRVVDLSSC